MYLAKRLTKRGKFGRVEFSWENSFYIGEKSSNNLAHNPAHRFLMYPFGQRIDRHNTAEICRIRRQQRSYIATFGEPFNIRMMHLTLIAELAHLTTEHADTAD